MAIMKYCAPCRVEKPVEQFYKAKGTYDKLSGVCKSCYNTRYGRKAVKQRDIPLAKRDPLDQKYSKESNAIRFLESLLLVYGQDTYKLDKNIQDMADDVGTAYRTAYTYLYILKELGLLRRTFGNGKNRAHGYVWYVTMNKPS